MSAIPENYPAFLAELAAAIATELRECVAIEQADAETIGYKVAEHVRANWGGLSTYIPKGDALELDRRDWEIYAKFNGRNYGELALEYDLTEMRIRQIVKACQVEEMRRRQAPLQFPS